MQNITYESLDKIDLPLKVKRALENRRIFANIRELEGKCYIIMNVPLANGTLIPICVKQDDRLTVYSSVSLPLEGKDFSDLVSEWLAFMQDRIEALEDELAVFEKRVGQGVKKRDADALFAMKRELILLLKSDLAMSEVLNAIQERKPHRLWSVESDQDYVNLGLEVHEIHQTLTILMEIIDGLFDVSNALYANRLNDVMMRLAVITCVIAIPTLVTSFYGMNLDLPFQSAPYALLVVIVISVALTSLTLWFLYKRHYLS